jgi:hypothetical protein
VVGGLTGARVAVGDGVLVDVGVGEGWGVSVEVGEAVGVGVEVAVGKGEGVEVGARNWDNTGRSVIDAWQPGRSQSKVQRTSVRRTLLFKA